MSRISYHRGDDGSIDRVDQTSDDGGVTKSYEPSPLGSLVWGDPRGASIGEQHNNTSTGESTYKSSK